MDTFLEAANEYFKTNPDPFAEAIYAKLKATMPILQGARFSNGDLWLDNQIIRNRQLVGVIDFENAGFSDPFLNSYYLFLCILNCAAEESSSVIANVCDLMMESCIGIMVLKL